MEKGSTKEVAMGQMVIFKEGFVVEMTFKLLVPCPKKWSALRSSGFEMGVGHFCLFLGSYFLPTVGTGLLQIPQGGVWGEKNHKN